LVDGPATSLEALAVKAARESAFIKAAHRMRAG
jgi:hypothetical protein